MLLWKAAGSGSGWQLLSFLRGLHSMVSLAAEAVPSEGRPLQQRRSTEHFAGSQGQQAAAAASHSSHGLAIWSDTHTSKAWHDIIGQLVHMLHDVASSPLPQTAGTASSTLATAAKCVEALLRLAPLLPRLPLPTAALGSGGFGGYVEPSPQGLALLEAALQLHPSASDRLDLLCQISTSQGLALASAELASWLAASVSAGLQAALPHGPVAVAEKALPALRACWTALKFEAAQAAFLNALEEAKAGGQQARLHFAVACVEHL